MKIQVNEHPVDRAIRILAGLGLGAALLLGAVSAPISYVVGAVAAILLVTGVVGFCPLYAILRISTCPVRR